VAGDTIVAVSTPPGAAPRAVVRLSGPRAAALAGVPPRPGCRASSVAGVPAVVFFFRSPRSYTREDLAELHLPGSPPLLEAAVRALVDAGARLARPGEFTQRAWLNGRIDLAGAEAVADLIDAGDAAEARAALDHRAFSGAVAEIESDLLDLCADVEAGIDFVGQDVEIVPPAAVAGRAGALLERLDALLRDTAARRVARDRPVAMLFGPANSGKSSLFNRLCGGSVIESDVAGTTRDVLRGEMDEVDLLDTAGWREASGVDAAAVARTEEMLDRADLVVFVVDASDPDRARDLVTRAASHPVLGVLNKCDLARTGAQVPIREWVRTSALTGEGVEELRGRIRRLLLSAPRAAPGARFHANLRQMGQLRRARAALDRVDASLGLELVALDLRDAADAFGALSGRSATEELLDRIFSRFCLGK
jgi:tRNA modification GTPase